MKTYFTVSSCQVKNLDKIYLQYFGYTQNGSFVDVGAYDGYQHSNTWGLAIAGWKGLCYEPVPEYYQRCVKNHLIHNIKSINTCVGNKKGTVEFNICGTISTYNKDYLNSEFWKNDYKNSQKIILPIITLNESLQENNWHNNFDVLSLDVEGAETDVLLGFDINYWKPKMAIVEAQELHPAKELSLQAPFINEYFKKAGYEKIYCDDINSIYVIQEFVEKHGVLNE